MCIDWLHRQWADSIISTIMLVATLSLVIAACTSFEQLAPKRSFSLEELLIGQDAMPSTWKVLGPPFFPAGDDLCTTECLELQFGVAASESPIQARYSVYRYLSTGIAQHEVEIEFKFQGKHFSSVSGWTYQGHVADQSHFDCFSWQGTPPFCEWAGRYEEYVVVFWTRLVPGEMSLADIERVVKAIDARMAQRLGKS